MMKNAFYFILKAFYVLKIFKFLSFWTCRKNGLIRKKVNFKNYDVTGWLTNNFNTHIFQ